MLLQVFLRGGADGLHLVPPVGDDAYYRVRPALAVKKRNAIPLTDLFGLHQDLSPLLPAWEAGDLAIVHQCGTADETRSHFEAEDYLHHGGLEGGGWLGRFLHQTRSASDGPLTAVSVGSAVSDSLRGAAAVSLRSTEEFTLPDKDPAFRPQLTALYQKSGGLLGHAGDQGLKALSRIESLRKSPANPQNGASYADDEFSSGLQLIARLIRAGAGLRAATIELGGWDSHFTQIPLTSGLMPRLAAGLASFYKDLGTAMREVHVVVMSEFGRRVAENVSLGTDHGRAGVAFVMGGGVKGGKVLSDWPQSGLLESALEGPGDLPVRHSFHHVLTPVLKRADPALNPDKVFPGLPAGALDV
ncbi:MAG TPA: DUF1501 domain-containing protein [Verrucomicrobiales bacterium]|nr:DUF1501 domain-containing protein [Verrucomicrobiales bacterium]